jgi:hypothetical protein
MEGSMTTPTPRRMRKRPGGARKNRKSSRRMTRWTTVMRMKRKKRMRLLVGLKIGD